MNKKVSNQRRHNFSAFRQLCNYIPVFLVAHLARETGVEKLCRTFSAWSQVVAMLYAQLTHSIGLNDLCDSLGLHSGPLSAIRGATPPKRNTLSHANAHRDATLAQRLFWSVLEHLNQSQPGFVGGRRRGLLRRFRCAAHAVDSTVIQLVANCMPWAKHRRRKAAAKLHVRLNLQSLLPSCAIIKTAAEHDNTRAVEVCAGLQEGESVIFDKAYVWFVHLWQLTQRGVFWVSRPKDNLDYRVKRRRIKKPQGKILRDDEIVLRGVKSKQDYPGVLRRVVALVTLDGVEQEMAFLTNNLTWSAQTIAELYRCRWDREVLPANQADAATGRLRGQQRERGEMADLDGPAVVCVAALPGFPEFLGLRVHPALGYLPFGGLGKNRPAGSIARLWDSSTAAAVKGGGAPGLFARPGAQTVRRLWDSIGFAYDGGDDEQAEKVLKYVGSLAGNTPRFPQEFWGRCPSYTFLWDATVLDFEF